MRMGKLQSKFRRRSDLYKAKEGAEPTPVHQVEQYEPTHTDAINCVVSLTSDLCVSGGHDQAVVVYEWRAGKRCKSFQGHSREITKLCCFKGSSLIFSASRDKTVLMWDLGRDTEPVQEFCGHELVVNGVAVSPDGSKLCTGSRDNSMRLWDIESGECLHKHTISRNLVTHVCWVPGSTSIVQTSEDKTIRVWDSRTWQVTNTFPAKQYIQTHCDISSNCYHLLSSSNGFGGQGCEATLWDLRQPGCKVAEYRGHLQTTACCMFVPPRPGYPALVASSSYDSSVKIWDQNTAACLYTLTLDGSGPLVSLAPCDSSSLLCASFNTGLHQLHLDQGAMPSLTEVARF
ncbi:WD repeat-containing protein 31-like [Sinocyclocheilus anshuiensis]|uniref:WD repeat-containing protein 31-like n=1 Tax=Sinocyclocheilus anshuiensis TaxID=1608454 RepID=UPI0007B93D73|nr:PREDICTED: WD repeat-containing protein 31-like [Sinocyclocheilus anshuiensis]XP_016314449.1 PREDICTED: WD repeat-containing protein 31-like [Sinocyclocheilus anshuiensis]XP_016314454.1 PREDICTED: WD repeat-containing protein 31-like [Sinocyclocheilus anshuiensis]XP_016314459.1 PREDICTED: WD repeat-containing protein 31-like [Sinocyclocheilus anshuiensis]XP_016314465.1 PREDICTED: WD repeat-containing protein 31-like [Sinocyclocheilus anshuiensis]